MIRSPTQKKKKITKGVKYINCDDPDFGAKNTVASAWLKMTSCDRKNGSPTDPLGDAASMVRRDSHATQVPSRLVSLIFSFKSS